MKSLTGDKIATNAVTGDKITNGTITNDKLSADVQQKLEQSGQMPSSVETLNVTYQLKVGTNSMYLGQNDAGAPNSIYTDDSALLMQSAGKNQNTLINANEDTGKVGVGTMYPSAKLDVKGPVKISPIAQAEFTDSFWLNFGTGLLMFYNDTLKTGEINSLYLGGTGGYSDLSLNGKNIFLNEKQSASLKVPAGNVGIGLLSGTTPKNKLDIAGSVAIGSSYAGLYTAPTNGLLVEGSVQIGVNTDTPTTKLQVGRGIMKTVIGSAYGDKTVSWGQAYIGFNARRENSGQGQWQTEDSPWIFDGDGGSNAGSIIYGDVGGNLRFATVASEVATPSKPNYSRTLKDTDIAFLFHLWKSYAKQI